MAEGWGSVKRETIVKCFKKCGIISGESVARIGANEDPFDDVDEARELTAYVERKVRALRERSPTMILCRNFSFIMRMRALIDGHWRAMRAMLLAVYLWRQRIHLA